MQQTLEITLKLKMIIYLSNFIFYNLHYVIIHPSLATFITHINPTLGYMSFFLTNNTIPMH